MALVYAILRVLQTHGNPDVPWDAIVVVVSYILSRMGVKISKPEE